MKRAIVVDCGGSDYIYFLPPEKLSSKKAYSAMEEIIEKVVKKMAKDDSLSNDELREFSTCVDPSFHIIKSAQKAGFVFVDLGGDYIDVDDIAYTISKRPEVQR